MAFFHQNSFQLFSKRFLMPSIRLSAFVVVWWKIVWTKSHAGHWRPFWEKLHYFWQSFWKHGALCSGNLISSIMMTDIEFKHLVSKFDNVPWLLSIVWYPNSKKSWLIKFVSFGPIFSYCLFKFAFANFGLKKICPLLITKLSNLAQRWVNHSRKRS